VIEINVQDHHIYIFQFNRLCDADMFRPNVSMFSFRNLCCDFYWLLNSSQYKDVLKSIGLTLDEIHFFNSGVALAHQHLEHFDGGKLMVQVLIT